MECINATTFRRKSGQMGHPAIVAGVARTIVGLSFLACSTIRPSIAYCTTKAGEEKSLLGPQWGYPTHYLAGEAKSESWGFAIAGSPTTTSVIALGCRYFAAMACTCSGVTAFTRCT